MIHPANWLGEITKSRGFSLVEVLIAIGIMSIVGLGMMSFIEMISDNQTKMSRKFEQRILLDQVRFLLSDAQLCKPSFDGQIDTEPLQNQSKDIDHLKWGANSGELVKVNDASSKLKVSRMTVSVSDAAPVTFTQADTSNPNNPPITLQKYLVTLTLKFERDGSGKDIPLQDVSVPFAINRLASDNSFVTCFTENSPARICEDELGGTYSSTDYPNCLITKLGVGLRHSSGDANLVIGPPGASHNRYTPSLAKVNGNLTVGETLFIGSDETAFFSRNFTSAPLPNDVSLFINAPSNLSPNQIIGAFRWDKNGVFHSHTGMSITYSAGPPYSETLGDHSNLSGIFGNWNAATADDLVMPIKGKALYRFDKHGVINAYSGYAFNNAGEAPGNAAHIASGQHTGLFAFWEPALPNDIGVFIRGDGQFRFHAGGDFIAKSNMYAMSFQTTSDERLKTDVHDIENALEKVTNLRGVEFTWNEKTPRQGQTEVGVIAQEVEKVFPQVVKEDLKGYKTVAYQYLVGPIVEAIKELRRQLVDHMKSINDLLAKMEAKHERDNEELKAMISTQQALIQKQQTDLEELKTRIEVLESNRKARQIQPNQTE